MKLVVVGFGQCGGRIADGFARLNARARSQRGIEIIPGTYAVNTDAADLTGLSTVKADYKHRILIGGEKTRGHGVAKLNEFAAEIAREDGDKVIDAIRSAKRFYETDAFLLVAGAAGGTGSGAIPIMINMIRDRHPDKPVYAVVQQGIAYQERAAKQVIQQMVHVVSPFGYAGVAVPAESPVEGVSEPLQKKHG